MLTNEQTAEKLASIEAEQAKTLAQVTKVGGETSTILAEVEALKAQIAAGSTASTEVQASIERISASAALIKTALQSVDDKVADPVAPPAV